MSTATSSSDWTCPKECVRFVTVSFSCSNRLWVITASVLASTRACFSRLSCSWTITTSDRSCFTFLFSFWISFWVISAVVRSFWTNSFASISCFRLALAVAVQTSFSWSRKYLFASASACIFFVLFISRSSSFWVASASARSVITIRFERASRWCSFVTACFVRVSCCWFAISLAWNCCRVSSCCSICLRAVLASAFASVATCFSLTSSIRSDVASDPSSCTFCSVTAWDLRVRTIFLSWCIWYIVTIESMLCFNANTSSSICCFWFVFLVAIPFLFELDCSQYQRTCSLFKFKNFFSE